MPFDQVCIMFALSQAQVATIAMDETAILDIKAISAFPVQIKFDNVNRAVMAKSSAKRCAKVQSVCFAY